MERICFHNKHDKISREYVAGLPADVRIIDIYSLPIQEQRELLDSYEIHIMPYLIDRQVILLSSTEQAIGTFVLDFEIRDYIGSLVTEKVDVHIFLTVSGIEQHENIQTDTGSFSLELTCSTVQDINLKITDYNSDDGIDLFQTVIKVVE